MSNIKVRVLVLAVLAVMGLSAIAATSASAAPQWLVEGVAFNGTETIGTTTQGGLLRLLSQLPGGISVVVGCELVRALGAHITGNNKNNAQGIEFSTCKVDEPVGCKVKQPILTKPLTSEIVELTAGKLPLFITFTPTVSEEFAPVVIEGCVSEGPFKVKLKTACEALAPETQAVIKLCKFNTNLFNTLKFGQEPATLLGTIGFQLIGIKKGQKWGANP